MTDDNYNILLPLGLGFSAASYHGLGAATFINYLHNSKKHRIPSAASVYLYDVFGVYDNTGSFQMRVFKQKQLNEVFLPKNPYMTAARQLRNIHGLYAGGLFLVVGGIAFLAMNWNKLFNKQ